MNEAMSEGMSIEVEPKSDLICQKDPTATIRIYNKDIYVETKEGGYSTNKPVALESLAKIFNETLSFHSPIVMGKDKMIAYAAKKYLETIVTVREPGVQKICIRNRRSDERSEDDVTYHDIPFPGAVVITVINKERQDEHHIFEQGLLAYEGKLTYDSPLYEFPCFNTYPGGGICWGSVETGPEDVGNITSIFFKSEFNFDLGSNVIKTVDNSNINYKDVYLTLVGLEEFPSEMLLQAGITLGELLERTEHHRFRG